MDIPERSQGLEYEDESNQNRENLLREPREEPSNGAEIHTHQYEHEDGRPHSDPESEFQEWNVLHLTEAEDQLFKDEGGASGAEHHQRLARKYRIEKVTNSNR